MFVPQMFYTLLQDAWILQASHLLSCSSEEGVFPVGGRSSPDSHSFPLSTSLGLLHQISPLSVFFNPFLLY